MRRNPKSIPNLKAAELVSEEEKYLRLRHGNRILEIPKGGDTLSGPPVLGGAYSVKIGSTNHLITLRDDRVNSMVFVFDETDPNKPMKIGEGWYFQQYKTDDGHDEWINTHRFLDRRFRGTGIAHKVYDILERHAAKESGTLLVDTKRKSTARFLEKRGYRLVGEAPGYQRTNWTAEEGNELEKSLRYKKNVRRREWDPESLMFGALDVTTPDGKTRRFGFHLTEKDHPDAQRMADENKV